jgi:hypothetical protein
VRFELEDAGVAGAAPTRRTLEFAASPQELEDLQARLRDAVRAAEGLLTK